MRWLLLDEIASIEKGKKAKARSHVPSEAYDSSFLMVEMMAQTGALVIGSEDDFQKDLVFAKIEHAKFLKPYAAGDPLEIEASAEDIRSEGAWLDGSITSNGEIVASARFLLMRVGQLIQGSQKPITFHEAFMQHFRVREKVAASQ